MTKRTICLILALIAVLSLCGCHYRDGGDILEPVEFFYPRQSAHFVYGSDDGVITSEVREASGHTNDLRYLISMYLRGPQNDTLRSPFPAGCTLISVRTDHDTLHIQLSEEFSSLENTEMTLACASLAKTCLSMTNYTYIHINSLYEGKTFSIELDASTLLLADHSAFDAPVAEE